MRSVENAKCKKRINFSFNSLMSVKNEACVKWKLTLIL